MIVGSTSPRLRRLAFSSQVLLESRPEEKKKVVGGGVSRRVMEKTEGVKIKAEIEGKEKVGGSVGD